VIERPAERRPTGVGDQHLDRAERVGDGRGQPRQPVEVCRVGDEGSDLAANFSGDGHQLLRRAAGDSNAGPLVRERFGDSASEPLAGAHHQRDPSL
jgi:hypothetical protein